MKVKRSISTFLVIAYILSIMLPTNLVKAATEYVSVTKTINVTQMTNEEEAEVTLSIKGTPPVGVVKPNDVVLIVDKSGSMGTDKMEAAKNAAKSFVDLIDVTKHQVGLVDFSSTANGMPLTTDKNSIKNRISSLSSGGGTETGVAIRSAIDILANHRPEAQPVIVILTDGQANNTVDALNAAQQAKDLGIVFYTIALLDSTDNPDTNQWNELLKNMATTSQHHHFVLGAQGLDAVYNAIVTEIGIASAYNVVVKDTISPNFELVPGSADGNIPKPIINGNELTWNFLELKQEALNLTYKIRHKTGQPMGTIPVGSSTTVSYNDYAGAIRNFQVASPSITVKYPAPSITSIKSDNGEVSGGNEVIITGEKFRQGATVSFGGKAPSNVTVVSPNEIRATVPAGTVGTVSVKVTNDDGQYATTAYTYWVNPVITSISPNQGQLAGGDYIYIYGQNFQTGATVKVGGQDVMEIVFVESSRIRARVPAASSPGTADVTVANPYGQPAKLPGAYTYLAAPIVPPPTITSITPNEGQLAGGEYIYIYGTDFKTGAKVKVGAQDAQIVFVESNRIRITIPAVSVPGAVDIIVSNPDGQSATLTGAYTYLAPPSVPAPTITSITPKEGNLAGGEYIYIYGTNFQIGAKVKVGNQDAQTIFVESNRIRITVPSILTPSTVDISVTNPDGQSATLPGAYTYLATPTTPAPTITSLSDTEGLLIGGENVYIFGTGFQQGVTVKLGGIDAQVINFYNSSQIRITIPTSMNVGSVDLQLTNPDGQAATLVSAYSYLAPPPIPAPTITSLSKTNGLITGGEYVYVNGTGFQQGLTVKLGGINATVSNFYSDKQFRILIPQGTSAGTVNLEIVNPDGQSAILLGAYTYTIPTPTITSLSTTSGIYNGGYSVFVYGTYFEPNAKVYVNGTEISSYYYSTSQIKILSMPSAQVLGVPNLGGNVTIEVRNPSGISATTNFTYQAKPTTPVPVITKITGAGGTVATGPIVGQNYIYFYGTGFSAKMKLRIYSPSNVMVYENSMTNYYNSTYARQYMPAVSTSGIYKLVLVSEDGIESNAMLYEYK